MKGKILCLILAVFISCQFIPFAGATEKDTFVGIVPFHAPEKILPLYSSFVDYLNKNTRVRWHLKIYPNHDSIIKALCDGEISIALVGPILAYVSNKECKAEPLILPLNEEGASEFKIYIVTADQKIKKIKDLQGKRIGLFKPITIANIVTRKMLEDEGLSDNNVKFVIYNTLERIINDVLTDEIKAGGVRRMSHISFQDLNLKVLKTSEPVPGFAFIASPKAPNPAKKEFVDVLMRLNSLEKNRFKEITSGWDEIIKHGFVVPQKGYLKDIERFYLMYERYKK
jgi:phosphonate transport system substrate-binding protein